jgi:hypothetical protein
LIWRADFPQFSREMQKFSPDLYASNLGHDVHDVRQHRIRLGVPWWDNVVERRELVSVALIFTIDAGGERFGFFLPFIDVAKGQTETTRCSGCPSGSVHSAPGRKLTDQGLAGSHSYALITFIWPRLTWPALARRQVGPWSRKIVSLHHRVGAARNGVAGHSMDSAEQIDDAQQDGQSDEDQQRRVHDHADRFTSFRQVSPFQ